MKSFCEFNDYEIVGEYEDAGKSGKSVEGRVAFKSMMEDIKTGKDGVSFVLVFKYCKIYCGKENIIKINIHSMLG